MSVGDSVTIYLIPSVQFSLETRSFSLENASQKISMAARKMCCILVGDLHASICILTFQFSHANGIMIAGMPLLDEGVMAAIKICRSPSSSSSKSFLFEDVLPFAPLLISKRNEYLQILFIYFTVSWHLHSAKGKEISSQHNDALSRCNGASNSILFFNL